MHNFPQYCIIQQRQNTDGKRNEQKGSTQQTEINAVPEHTRLFLIVIKSTLMVSQRHSLDLE